MTILRRVTAAAVLALVALVATTGCTTTDPESKESTSTPTGSASPAVEQVLTKPDMNDTLLFVARSPEASLDLDENGDGTLTLSSAPTMTWFSDRPDHDAGTATTTDALKSFGWKDNGDDLGDEPPNAVLTGSELADAVVVELLTADLDGDELSLTVKAVNDVPAAERNVEVSHADLFIDDVGAGADFPGDVPAVGTLISSAHNGIGVAMRGAFDFQIDFLMMPDNTRAANVRVRAVYKDVTGSRITGFSGWYPITLTADKLRAPETPYPFSVLGTTLGRFFLDPVTGAVTVYASAEHGRESLTLRP
jgi:hypothetical protein